MALRIAALAAALLCFSCAPKQTETPPLVPETAIMTGPSSRPAPVTRSFESKTIGADPYSVHRPPNASGTSAAPARRGDAWSPTPVYGVSNPSPPGPATPIYGDMNPSPPGR